MWRHKINAVQQLRERQAIKLSLVETESEWNAKGRISCSQSEWNETFHWASTQAQTSEQKV